MKDHRVNNLANKVILVGLLHFERPRLQVQIYIVKKFDVACALLGDIAEASRQLAERLQLL